MSITKNCETLVEQTHRKSEKTLEFKMSKPRVTYHFKPPVPNEGSWKIGLTSLQVYKSILTITEENNKFNLDTDPSHEISFVKMKDKLTEVLGFSLISNEGIQHDLLGLDLTKSC